MRAIIIGHSPLIPSLDVVHIITTDRLYWDTTITRRIRKMEDIIEIAKERHSCIIITKMSHLMVPAVIGAILNTEGEHGIDTTMPDIYITITDNDGRFQRLEKLF